MKAPGDLLTKLPDLDDLNKRLKDPSAVLDQAFPVSERSLRARAIVDPGVVRAIEEVPAATSSLDSDRVQIVEAGARGVAKLHRDGDNADLEPEEIAGLEAIVLIEGRPAILIQNGSFFPPPVQWDVLNGRRADIESTLTRVGRVEVTGHPSFEWIGTGFLVAANVLMTNRHVAEEFSQMGARRRWSFKAGMEASVDYVEELGSMTSADFKLRSVIGVHETLDLALFEVEATSLQNAPAPAPLTVASEPPGGNPESRQVYVVGYPAWDGRRNDPEIMQRLFSNIFNVKRLQPGQIMGLDPARPLFRHDCSTLGGNSGSCVVDLETNQVVGLHFGGRYRQSNHAVALWQLVDDPLLKRARVNFD